MSRSLDARQQALACVLRLAVPGGNGREAQRMQCVSAAQHGMPYALQPGMCTDCMTLCCERSVCSLVGSVRTPHTHRAGEVCRLAGDLYAGAAAVLLRPPRDGHRVAEA